MDNIHVGPKDIFESPPPCVLCGYFMLPEDCLPGDFVKIDDIGPLCEECAQHNLRAMKAIFMTPGIAGVAVWFGPNDRMRKSR